MSEEVIFPVGWSDPVPVKVWRRQAIQVLINDGTLALVQPAINALDDGTPVGAAKKATAQNEWDNSIEFYRDRPLLIELATSIGYDTPEKRADLFTRANAL